MPENMNWDSAYLPLIGVIVGCIAAVIIYKVISNRIEHKNGWRDEA